MTPDPILKVCGITRLVDALHALRQGATALGFVFWPTSPRAISPRDAGEIIAALPKGTTALFAANLIDSSPALTPVQLSIVAPPIPEPASFALACVAVVGWFASAGRRRDNGASPVSGSVR